MGEAFLLSYLDLIGQEYNGVEEGWELLLLRELINLKKWVVECKKRPTTAPTIIFTNICNNDGDPLVLIPSHFVDQIMGQGLVGSNFLRFPFSSQRSLSSKQRQSSQFVQVQSDNITQTSGSCCENGSHNDSHTDSTSNKSFVPNQVVADTYEADPTTATAAAAKVEDEVVAEASKMLLSVSFLNSDEKVFIPKFTLVVEKASSTKDVWKSVSTNSQNNLVSRVWVSGNSIDCLSFRRKSAVSTSYSSVSISENNMILLTETVEVLELEKSKLQRIPAILFEMSKCANPNYDDWHTHESLQKQWIESLRPGEYVDAKDKTGTWLPAIIKSISSQDGSILVKFRGWSEKFDEKVDTSSKYVKILPSFTITKDWRSQLVCGAEVDMKVEVSSSDFRWIPGRIKSVNTTTKLIECTTSHASSFLKSIYYFYIQDDDICPPFTHCKKLMPTFVIPVGSSDYNFFQYRPTYDASFFKKFRTSYSFEGEAMHETGETYITGAVGLSNVGNTCFMNAVLQCMSNHSKIRTIFGVSKDASESDIAVASDTTSDAANRLEFLIPDDDSLLSVFSKLICNLWSDKYRVLDMRPFKQAVDASCPLFQGYVQHDAMEFLQFLIDNLHCSFIDNNKTNLPALTIAKMTNNFASSYSSSNPSNSSSNSNSNSSNNSATAKPTAPQLALFEAWKTKNRSPLVNLMFGLIQSTLTCQNCRFETISSDVFNNLCLPLPNSKLTTVDVLVAAPAIARRIGFMTIEISSDSIANNETFFSQTMKLLASTSSLEPCDTPFFLDSASKTLVLTKTCLVSTQRKDLLVISGHEIFSSTPLAAAGGNLHISHAVGDKNSRLMLKNSFFVFDPIMKGIQVANLETALQSHLNRSTVYIYSRESGVTQMSGKLTHVALPFDLIFASHATSASVVSGCKVILMQYLYKSSQISNTDSLKLNLEFVVCDANSLAIKRRLGEMISLGSSKLDLLSSEALMIILEREQLVGLPYLLRHKECYESFMQNSFTLRQGYSLHQCCKMFFEQEMLTLENSRQCEGCKRTIVHLRKLDLAIAPENLIVQLKRFVFNTTSMGYEKAEQCVYYPINNFDISPYVVCSNDRTASLLYDLVGVVNHAGSMNGGHYTALALNDFDKTWYLYDDSRVCPLHDNDDIQCANAYLLFYRKKN